MTKASSSFSGDFEWLNVETPVVSSQVNEDDMIVNIFEEFWKPSEIKVVTK